MEKDVKEKTQKNNSKWGKVVCSSLFVMLLFFLPLGDVSDNFMTLLAKAETIVYITPTGSKYHTHKCGNGTYYAATLSEAKARGLTACSKCFGSGSSSTSCANTKKQAVKRNIKINKIKKLLVVGQSVRLKVTGTSSKVYWSSSKKTVASVSSNGKVKAKKAGKAKITARVGSSKKHCMITVEAPRLNKKSVTMKIGQTTTLKLSGCKHTVKWKCNDTDIASVSSGKITAKDAGKTTIKAIVHGKTYKCKITVKKPVVESLSVSDKNITMECDTTKVIKLTASPKKVWEYYNITAISSDEEIVSVYEDENGIELVSYEKEGTATISVTLGQVTKKVSVTVVKPEVEKITLNQTELTLQLGESSVIYYEIQPADAESYYDAKWESASENIAKIEEYSGYTMIVAVEEGETDIIVTVGNLTATCHVIVKKEN